MIDENMARFIDDKFVDMDGLSTNSVS